MPKPTDFVKVCLGGYSGQMYVRVPGRIFGFRSLPDQPDRVVCKELGGVDLTYAFLHLGLDSIEAVGSFVAEARGLAGVQVQNVPDIWA